MIDDTNELSDPHKFYFNRGGTAFDRSINDLHLRNYFIGILTSVPARKQMRSGGATAREARSKSFAWLEDWEKQKKDLPCFQPALDFQTDSPFCW